MQWSKFLFPQNQEKILQKQKEKILKKIKKSSFSPYEHTLIESIMNINTILARDIMIPRIDVAAFNTQCRKSELELHLKSKNFSRIPIYSENIDNIKGIIHIKDIFKIILTTNNNRKIDLSKYLSIPFYSPESRKIIDILKDLQKNKIHMAIIVDEYGGFSGIVTMEDILEEIIGDVQDEFDSEQEEIRTLSINTYSIDARTNLEDINKQFNLNLKKDNGDTIGGFVIGQEGYIPKVNQVIHYKNIQFKILSKRRNSITRIRMKILSKEVKKLKNI